MKTTPPPGSFDFDVAVVGGGPGGLVTALYLRRFLRSAVQFDAGAARAAAIAETRNLLGQPHGISGAALMQKLRKQIDGCGGAERVCEAATVTPSDGGYEVRSATRRARVRVVVLATGIDDVQPAVGDVRSLTARALLRYCPVCDAFEHRGDVLAVLAGDERGLRSARFLAPYAKTLHVVVPPEVRVGETGRALVAGGAVLHRARLEALEPAQNGRALDIALEGVATPLRVRAAYVELGSRLKDSAFEGTLALKRSRVDRIVTDRWQRTSAHNVYAVGDCCEGLGQIAVAAGHAAVAATDAHNALRALGL